MNVLAIDIGGTYVKMLASAQTKHVRFPSGKLMTPSIMVAKTKELTREWKYDVISIDYPGVVKNGRISAEPNNLGKGWTKFNFKKSFGKPVKIINDSAMQALGSYKKGTMLFVGLGTGLGSAIVSEGVVVSLEIGELSFRKGTYSYYLGARGLKRMGKKKWRGAVAFGVGRLAAAIHPDDIVLGGGNSKNLKKLPHGCRLGHNKYAFTGGFRMWQDYKPLKDSTTT